MMAKRKRLTPANPEYLVEQSVFDAPTTRLSSQSAPIASVASDASVNAALIELSETFTKAKENGRMILDLPLEAIEPDYLVRDRIAIDDEEMANLIASIVARGQQTPIEVVALGSERYGLISGWRRLQALQRIAQDKHLAGQQNEESADVPVSIQAILRAPKDASAAYQAMIEENEIRSALSYYERARIVLKAVEHGVFEDERAALRSFYHAASRAKRSKIGSFITVVRKLDGILLFPQTMGERLGLRLAKALEEGPSLAHEIIQHWQKSPPQDSAHEHQKLDDLLDVPVSRTKQKTAQPPENTLFEAGESSSHSLAPGLVARVHKNGSLTLKGARIDAAFRDKLFSWLSKNSE